MSIASYGNKKLASIHYSDVDIFYSYSKNRHDLGDVVLKPLYENILDDDLVATNIPGVFKLRLRADVFSENGFYFLVFKPKSIKTVIYDCSQIILYNQTAQVLKNGIIIPRQENMNLKGYYVEYLDAEDNIEKNKFHIVSDFVHVTPSQLTTANNPLQTKTYAIDNNGNYTFLALEPSESLFQIPQDFGKIGQHIILTHSFFDPFFIELEITEYTIKTLSYALYGNSMRDNETGVYSIFDDEQKLFKQYNLITSKKKFSRGTIDYREERKNINNNTTFQEMIDQQ